MLADFRGAENLRIDGHFVEPAREEVAPEVAGAEPQRGGAVSGDDLVFAVEGSAGAGDGGAFAKHTVTVDRDAGLGVGAVDGS